MTKYYLTKIRLTNIERGLFLGLYGACGMLALVNFNISIMLILIITFFAEHKMGFAEYWTISIPLLIKSQSENVLSSTDLLSYCSIYNYISSGGKINEVFDKGEILLPSFFFVVSKFISTVNIRQLSFFFVFSFLLIAYPLVSREKKNQFLFVSILVFLDVNMIVHLYRQMLSSLLLLYFLTLTCCKKNQVVSGFLLFSSILTHITAVFFAIYAFIGKKLKFMMLKIIMIIFFLLGRTEMVKNLVILALIKFHGVAILGKSSYALNVIGNTGGIRLVAVIGIIMAFFLDEEEGGNYLKYFMVFSSTTLLFYCFPILAPRSGLIATSILTGVPIGLFIKKIKWLINMVLRYFVWVTA